MYVREAQYRAHAHIHVRGRIGVYTYVSNDAIYEEFMVSQRYIACITLTIRR